MQWAATEMPRYRAGLRSEIAAVEGRDGATDTVTVYSAALRTAQLLWVSRDMTRVAMDASADLPAWTPLAAMPSPTGIVCFAQRLPPLRASLVDAPDLDVPVCGMVWALTRDAVEVTALAMRVDVESRMPAGLRLGIVGDLLPAAQTRFPSEQPITEYSGEAGGLVAMLGATWLLSAQPTVAETRERTGAGGRGVTRSDDRTVKLVDLRRLAQRPHEPTGEKPQREYRHRWMVRGHWRQQAWGPKRGLRRPTWVPSYIKGPEGAPLLEGETVFVWRR